MSNSDRSSYASEFACNKQPSGFKLGRGGPQAECRHLLLVRICVPRRFLRKDLLRDEVLRFQSGPCWLVLDHSGLTIIGLRVRLHRRWLNVWTASEVERMVEGGEITQQNDLEVVLESLGTLMPPY